MSFRKDSSKITDERVQSDSHRHIDKPILIPLDFNAKQNFLLFRCGSEHLSETQLFAYILITLTLDKRGGQISPWSVSI